MTQENEAADREQNFNDASEETTVAANEAFAQDWLDAEEKERAEQTNVAERPRLVATLPDWAAFGESRDEKKSLGGWRVALRDGKLRTTGVALAAFGLGFFCAAGSWRGETADENATDAAAVELKTDVENVASPDAGGGEFGDDALAAIDSSTLRSVPETTVDDFVAQTRGNVAPNGDNWANNGGTAGFGNLTTTQEPTTNASWTDDSSWRRGVDFQRELTAPTETTANVDRFPTWNDLDANFPTVADVLNAPIESATSVAADAPASENTTGVAQNSTAFAAPSDGENADYAAYNGSADYQGADAAISNGAAPQFAGNSQNSGYNQTNGSENFAGWPTTAPAPNYASVAPAPTTNFATTAPAPTANFATTAPAPTANFATPTPAPNYASVAPAPTANFATTAPAPNYASVAPAPTANFATTAPAPTTAPRAMVAQVPNESAPAPTANVPASNPNLRW